MALSNIIFSFFLLIVGYYLNKYFLLIANKKKFNLFLDNQFIKPQAFHINETHSIGGVTIFLLLIIVCVYLFIFKDIFYTEYISFCTLFFILGLIDDAKVNIRPKFRLLIMIAILILLVIFNELYIQKTGLAFLNNLLDIDIFALFFICLCLLFIINGANLIDGFNGLLGIHALIITFTLFFINLINENNQLAYFLFFVCIIIVVFLIFNFPKAQIFLGDSGAYLIGSLVAISVVKTSIAIPSVHPFFFCILLFYLFFEVFFSFFRKIFIVRLSPLFPDNNHLHMLIYKILIKKNKSKLISNYSVSIYINLIYLLLIIPGIIFIKDGIFCRYYFFTLLLLYIYSYKKIYEKIK